MTTDVNWFKEKDLDIVNGRYSDKQFKLLNPGDITITITYVM